MTTKYFASSLILFSLIFSCCGCSLLGIESARTGNELFVVQVLDPMPTSVTVFHSQDEILFFEPKNWLHFTIAPDDFELILATESWEINTLDYDGIYNTEVEEWWPESFEDYTRYTVYNEDRRYWKDMWVNSSNTEVYFRIVFN